MFTNFLTIISTTFVVDKFALHFAYYTFFLNKFTNEGQTKHNYYYYDYYYYYSRKEDELLFSQINR